MGGGKPAKTAKSGQVKKAPKASPEVEPSKPQPRDSMLGMLRRAHPQLSQKHEAAILGSLNDEQLWQLVRVAAWSWQQGARVGHFEKLKETAGAAPAPADGPAPEA